MKWLATMLVALCLSPLSCAQSAPTMATLPGEAVVVLEPEKADESIQFTMAESGPVAVITMEGETKDVVFSANNREILRVTPDGMVFVKGSKTASSDVEFYTLFKAWLGSCMKVLRQQGQ